LFAPESLESRALAGAAEERRRIARDLHDGTQQRLVILVVGLSELASLIDHDQAQALRMAQRLENEAQEALEELRLVVHNIQPPELTDFGLAEALHHIARSSPVPVRMITHGVGRYDRAIEDAVYFTCREALQNTIKHAPGSTDITLSLMDRGDLLEFEVEDDGRGFAAALAGTGFASMHHRVEALGGTLSIKSAPGTGTRIHGKVPLAQ
jgi:signal transduction histidine kinase